MIQKLAQFTDIRAALVVGGLSLQAQAATLRSQPEVVVATPVSAALHRPVRAAQPDAVSAAWPALHTNTQNAALPHPGRFCLQAASGPLVGPPPCELQRLAVCWWRALPDGPPP
jgi:hypothetical protein